MFKDVDFSKMSSMLEEAKKKAEELQNETKSKTFTAKSGGGLISVSCDGSGEVIDMNIDDSLLEDKEAMQILLISCINTVLKMAEDEKKLLASKMFGDFGKL